MTKEPTVLIIDDDPSARETLEMLLIPEGYDLVFAQNGQEGFATALEILPDVVLCDVMMPGMDGFEVCRRVRAEHQLAEVPFILLSALDDRASKLRGLAVGADEFISKPLDSVELRMRLRTITRLARFRRLSNERGWLSRISEHTEDGYLVLEPDGSIAAANHQARLQLGLPGNGQGPFEGTFTEWARKAHRLKPAGHWSADPANDPMSIGVTRYLVRPQSPGCPSIWLQVHCVDSEDVPSARRLMRLRDITDHVGRYTQIWQLAAASLELSTAMSLLLPAVEALGTATESLPGQRPDEWLRQAHAASLRLRQATENIMRLANATRLSHLRDRFAVAEFPGIVQRLAAGLDLPPITVFVEPDAENVHLALAVADIELIVGEIMEGAKQFHPRRSPQLDISVAGPTDGRLRLAFGCDDAGPTPEQMSRAWTPLDQSPSSPANERPAIAADLSIVSALVWGLGGRYRIQPRQPGPGAVVDVILPRAGDEE